MLRVNILSNDKDIIIKLPKSSHEMAAELRKAGIDISPERLTLKSNVGHNYLIGLYTEDPLGDVVIDRICDNDNLAELNKLCQVLDESSDRDNMMRILLNSDVHCKRLYHRKGCSCQPLEIQGYSECSSSGRTAYS